MILLRAKCIYCHHFRLAPIEINRIVCKLKLIQYGLVAEVEEIEKLSANSKTLEKDVVNGAAHSRAESSDDESELEDTNLLARKRKSFIEKSIEEAEWRDWRGEKQNKVEAVQSVRRAVVKEFLSTCGKPRACASCNG